MSRNDKNTEIIISYTKTKQPNRMQNDVLIKNITIITWQTRSRYQKELFQRAVLHYFDTFDRKTFVMEAALLQCLFTYFRNDPEENSSFDEQLSGAACSKHICYENVSPRKISE